ncbi:MAG: hypothetical protein ACE5FT_01910 [Candidatus Nanoarchaeia archaeon]
MTPSDKSDVKAPDVPTEPIKVKRWVLIDIITNPYDGPTSWKAPPGRGYGSSGDWTVAPGSISHHLVEYDYDKLIHDWDFLFKFGSPLPIMEEGDKLH